MQTTRSHLSWLCALVAAGAASAQEPSPQAQSTQAQLRAARQVEPDLEALRSAQAFLAGLPRANAAELSSVTTEEFTLSELGAADPRGRGADAAVRAVQPYRTAFPDMQITPKRVLQTSRVVVVQASMAGTHQGRFAGRAPTEKRVSSEMLFVGWTRGGRVERSTLHWGDGALTRQIDSPEPATPPGEEPSSAEPIRSRARFALDKRLTGQLYGVAAFAIGARLARLQGNDDVGSLADRELVLEEMVARRDLLRPYSRALSGLQVELLDVFSAGDFVVARARASGAHRRELAGIRPTGRTVSWHVWIVAEVREGLIVRAQSYLDESELRRQLG